MKNGKHSLPAFDLDMGEVCKILSKQNSLSAIERKTGVCTSTMRKWMQRKTRRPQHQTMKFALRGAGFDFAIVPRK